MQSYKSPLISQIQNNCFFCIGSFESTHSCFCYHIKALNPVVTFPQCTTAEGIRNISRFPHEYGFNPRLVQIRLVRTVLHRSELLIDYFGVSSASHSLSVLGNSELYLLGLPAVGIATGYGLNDRGVGVRVPVGSVIFTSPYRPYRLQGPPKLLPKGYQGLLAREKAAGA
jgi:hypothetical protein